MLLCTLIAPLVTSDIGMSTVVVDLPFTTFWSGILGLGSSAAQVPSWMCAGCASPRRALQLKHDLGLAAL